MEVWVRRKFALVVGWGEGRCCMKKWRDFLIVTMVDPAGASRASFLPLELDDKKNHNRFLYDVAVFTVLGNVRKIFAEATSHHAHEVWSRQSARWRDQVTPMQYY